MSRIGKASINVPKDVLININNNLVSVKGPKGFLTQVLDRDFKIEIIDSLLTITRPSNQIRHKALHGLYRSLIGNMLVGVTVGYKKNLELVGVGFKATNINNILDLSLGYSHNIIFQIPNDLNVNTLTEKGKNPTILLEGIDKQLIGQVASKIRSLRKPEPYKGKGVKYTDEIIRRKAGKAAGK